MEEKRVNYGQEKSTYILHREKFDNSMFKDILLTLSIFYCLYTKPVYAEI